MTMANIGTSMKKIARLAKRHGCITISEAQAAVTSKTTGTVWENGRWVYISAAEDARRKVQRAIDAGLVRRHCSILLPA